MQGSFQEQFSVYAAHARRRLLIRKAISAGGLGAVVGGALLLTSRLASDATESSALLLLQNAQWWSEFPAWQLSLLVGPLGCALGAILGAVWARWRRPNDEALALAFDHKLGAHQEIVAALDASLPAPWRHAAATSAATQLSGASLRLLRPGIGDRLQASYGIAAVLFLAGHGVSPPRLLTTPTLGTQVVQFEGLAELDELAALEVNTELSERDRRKLREISEQARELSQKLKEGVSQREALADVARLQTTVTRALLDLEDPRERAGLQAAVRVLEESPATLAAARALAGSDLDAFDAEMRRLSSAEERSARRQAELALERAQRAAQEEDAIGVARALAESADIMQESAAAETIAEPADAERTERQEDAPNETAGTATAGVDPGPTPSGPQLDSQNAKQRAPEVQQGIQSGNAQFHADERAAEAAQSEGETPKQGVTHGMSASQRPSTDAPRQQQLRRAAEALRRLQNTLSERDSALPNPTPGPESSAAHPSRSDSASSTGESDHQGDHSGRTASSQLPGLHAKTEQTLDLRNGRITHSAGRGNPPSNADSTLPTPAGVTASGPNEVQSVERARIPTEYKEQVSRYFSGQ